MRLADLSPRWWAESPDRYGQGVSFLCPCCQVTRLAVAFENPLDGGSVAEHKTRLWRRCGEEFDVLTIRPSIDATLIHHGHWKVTAGEVRHG